MTFRPRFLYVDDEPTLLSAFERVFRREGVEVVTTGDPRKALELLAEGGFHVVASDYQMPEMDGLAFLERATEIEPDLPKILITGHADFDTAVSAINRARVYRFITKPWKPRDVRRTFAQAAEQVRLTRENARLGQLIAEQNAELERINRDLEHRVHDRTKNVLDGLVLALDYRDTETQWHSRRVSEYAGHLAGTLGIEDDARADVEWGALLHDVGKIGIPDHILLKPGPLTEDEWVTMRKHPKLGYDLLKDIDFLREAALIVAHHHERFDGAGYPVGRVGEDIVIGARIFAVIDTFDAMTSDRPYRKALPYEAAFEEIQRVSGTQLDPHVVEAWCAVPQEEWRRIREEIGGADYHKRIVPPLTLAKAA
jgi:putative nucleotidyltransferase with HDIG domain